MTRKSQRTEVKISRKIINFFKKQPHLGIYIPLDPKISSKEKISYDSLIGEHAPSSPNEKEITKDGPLEYFFTNTNKRSKKQADSVAKYIIRQMNQDISTIDIYNIQKSYMLNGGTRPVKIRFKHRNNGCRHPIYAKQGDAKRLFGLFLYNIINGMDQTEFGFNEKIIVEKEISGTLLSQTEENALLFMPEYREGLMRAAVHMDFLYSSDTRKDNRIVADSYKTVLLDFDDIFLPQSNIENALIFSYKNTFNPNSKEIEIMLDEQKKVYERIENNNEIFMDFLSLAKDMRIRSSYPLRDGSLKIFDESLDDRIKKISDARNLEEYYMNKLESYRYNSQFINSY